MANARPYTHLSLDRYARIMGINPAHFNTAYTDSIFNIPADCDDLWFPYAWQRPDVTSRGELVQSIRSAEDDIGRVLGYQVAPTFTEAEEVRFPAFHREYLVGTGLQPGGRRKSVRVDNAKIIASGQRAVASGGTLTVAGGDIVFSDEDSDGVSETVTISATISASTDAGQIWQESWYNSDPYYDLGLYLANEDGARWAKLRDMEDWSVTANGDDYDISCTFKAWQFVDRSLSDQEYPSSGDRTRGVNFSNTNNLYQSVEVWLEYPDQESRSVVLYWDENTSDAVLTNWSQRIGIVTQNGTFSLRNAEEGTIVPYPATYSDDNGYWSAATYSVRRDPDFVRVWYLSGDRSSAYRSKQTPDPLSNYLAQAIAWLATARLVKPICACGAVRAAGEELRTDLVISSEQGNFAIGIEEVMNNPFGTRLGEVRAWRRVARLAQRNIEGGSL